MKADMMKRKQAAQRGTGAAWAMGWDETTGNVRPHSAAKAKEVKEYDEAEHKKAMDKYIKYQGGAPE